MRFAWIKKNSTNEGLAGYASASSLSLVRTVYNVAWWLPILLTFLRVIDYRTGFIVFTVVTFARLAANLYVNNVLEPVQFDSFPFRM